MMRCADAGPNCRVDGIHRSTIRNVALGFFKAGIGSCLLNALSAPHDPAGHTKAIGLRPSVGLRQS